MNTYIRTTIGFLLLTINMLSYAPDISIFNPTFTLSGQQIEEELKKSDKELAAHARAELKRELALIEKLERLPENHRTYQELSKKNVKKAGHALKLRVAHVYKKLLLERASDEYLAQRRREHLLKMRQNLAQRSAK
jgi:hypothetical protein